MKQRQRRQKIARIRNEQKYARFAKRPQPKVVTRLEVEHMVKMVARFVAEDEKTINEKTEKMRRYKKYGTICSPILLIISIAIGTNLLSVITVSLALAPWIQFYVVSEGMDFWQEQLKINSDYLKDMERSLQRFDNNKLQCA